MRLRKLALYAIGGLALLGYIALSFGLFGSGFGDVGDGLLSPDETVVVGSGTPDPSGTTRGPSPTPLPESVLASRGETFVLANAGVVTHGARVTMTGQGFVPSEQVIVTLNGEGIPEEREVGRGFANKEGLLENVGFEVPPDIPSGRYTATVTAPKSGKSASGDFEVSGGQPGVEPDVFAAKPGSMVKFTGGGFQPGETIAVYFDSIDGSPLGTLTASPGGTIRGASVEVPLTAEGPHAFIFVGEQSKMPARVPVAVNGLYPFITLDNYVPLPQQSIGISGEDFFPGERVFIFFGAVGTTPAAIATADDKGAINLAGAVEIPVEMRGPATLVARGEMSGLETGADFEITEFAPVLEMTVYNGPPGTSVAFTGSAFAKGETVRVYGGTAENQKELTTFETGPTGAFKAAGAFEVPLDMPPGDVDITAVGDKSRVPVTIVFAVEGFRPNLNLTAYAGKAGDTTAITGSGFVPGETLTVHIGGAEGGQEMSSFKAGPDGSFEDAGAFVVPFGTPPGELTITVVGDQSNSPAELEYTVLPFSPWAGMDSYAGPVGSQVRFIGGSFAPDEIVNVHLGDTKGRVVLSVTADEEGKFALSDPYTVEASGGGDVSFALVGEISGGQAVVKYKLTESGGPGGAPADERPSEAPAATPAAPVSTATPP